MPYATTEDLVHACGGADRYIQLFDWDGDGTADVDVIERAHLLADGKIDGYARKRFATPIASPSSTLRAFAADLVVHETRKVRGVIGEAEVQAAERSHRMWLEDLAAGKVSSSDPEPTRTSSSTVTTVENASPFSRAEMRRLF
jgi:phage gp36-like protein